MIAPWRPVVASEKQPSPNSHTGGSQWLTTLSCGHQRVIRADQLYEEQPPKRQMCAECRGSDPVRP